MMKSMIFSDQLKLKLISRNNDAILIQISLLLNVYPSPSVWRPRNQHWLASWYLHHHEPRLRWTYRAARVSEGFVPTSGRHCPRSATDLWNHVVLWGFPASQSKCERKLKTSLWVFYTGTFCFIIWFLFLNGYFLYCYFKLYCQEGILMTLSKEARNC